MVETTILPDRGQKGDDRVVRGRYGRVGGLRRESTVEGMVIGKGM